MTETLLESSAPVFEIDGQVKGELARDLQRLEVEETTAGLKTLSAWLLGHGPKSGKEQEVQLYLDGELLDFGKQINATIGPPADQRTIFKGFISGIEASFHEGQEP